MFGLSWAGLAVALTILAPSFLLIPWPARNAPSPLPKVGVALAALERIGQVGTLVLATVIVGEPGHPAWLGMVLVAVLAYYGLWVRYFARGREFSALYAPLGPLPVPNGGLPGAGVPRRGGLARQPVARWGGDHPGRRPYPGVAEDRSRSALAQRLSRATSARGGRRSHDGSCRSVSAARCSRCG